MSLEDRPENYNSIYAELSKLIGVDNTKKIYEEYRGQQISFPNHNYTKEYIQTYLLENYNGKNMRNMAKKFGYTERRLRQLLKEVGS